MRNVASVIHWELLYPFADILIPQFFLWNLKTDNQGSNKRAFEMN
jgi:hypothetical protein